MNKVEDIKDLNIKEMKLDEIIILDRLRSINTDMISPLSDSIQKNGLLNPITINQNNILISGYHRYTACKELNFETILCNIVNTEDEDKMKLIEIDENLIRAELHYFDLSEQLKLRKEIYERLFPETVLGASGKGRKKEKKSFVDDVAKKINKSKSTIYNLLNVYNTLSSEEKAVIKELNIPQTDTRLLISLDSHSRKDIFEIMKKRNLNMKKSMKYLKNEREFKNYKIIKRPLDNKFINHIQVGNLNEIIKNIPEEIKYDCLFIDINNYSEDKNKQLKEIDNILNNVDILTYDESLLFFFSNEEIDNKLESKLIKKFKKVERMIQGISVKREDSLFNEMNSTIYICRNFINNQKNRLGNENYFITKNHLIPKIMSGMHIENMRILDVYTNSSDTLEFCISENLNYFGICSNMSTYKNLEKVVDLTSYINDDFINYCTSFDIDDIYILKNNILTIDINNNNRLFLLKINDEINEDFRPINFNHQMIKLICNMNIIDKDFKIWAYHNDIKYINDKKIDFLKNNYDDELKKQGIEEYFNYFNSDI